MKKRMNLLAALAAVLLLGSCDNSETSARYMVEDEMVEVAARATGGEPIPVAEAAPAAVARKIIKTGELNLRVGRIDEARRRVDSLVAGFGGYYAREVYGNQQSYGTGEALTLTIRVPFDRFDALVAALESGRGELLSKNIDANDVSEAFVDIQTRLANKRGYLERYRALLARAGTIEEILEVEEHVRTLEEEIESAEGRLRYLTDQTALGTLTLTLSTEGRANPHSFGSRLAGALTGGWRAVVAVLIGLVHLWPFLLIAAPVVVLIRRRSRRKKQNRAS